MKETAVAAQERRNPDARRRSTLRSRGASTRATSTSPTAKEIVVTKGEKRLGDDRRLREGRAAVRQPATCSWRSRKRWSSTECRGAHGADAVQPGGHCSPPGWVMSRAIARCSSSRSRIAAPKAPTTNGSSSSAIRCSTCCCPSGCTANFPPASEGDLSRLRARLVSEEPLAEIAQAMQLGELLLLGSGELKTGGFRRQSILADAFEALCGALYLDGGLDAVRAHASDRCSSRASPRCPSRRRSRTPRRVCRNTCRPMAAPLPVYTVKRTSGEPHAQTFLVSCSVPHACARNRRRGAEPAARRTICGAGGVAGAGLYD